MPGATDTDRPVAARPASSPPRRAVHGTAGRTAPGVVRTGGDDIARPRPPRRRPLDEAPARPTFRADVQGLRAVAVGLVVLGHAGVPGLAGGFVGVDVFFVLSGFLITGLLLADAAGAGRVGFGDFYARRATRILPAATVVIVATALASVHILNFVRAKSVLTDSVWATFFAANVHFSREGTDYFASGTPVSPLQHFWSLAVEEQFYLLWPALLALTLFGVKGLRAKGRRAARRRRRLLRGRVVLVLLAVGGVSLYVSSHKTGTDPTAAYFSTIARTWELAAGAMLATLMPVLRRVGARAAAALTWIGVAGVGLAALTFDATTPFPGTAALLPVLGTCAVIVGGINSPAYGANEWLARQPLRYLGDISYSLYLWHWPVLILGAAYAGHALSIPENLALVLLAVALSAVSYAVVENPLRHSRTMREPRRVGRVRAHPAMALWPAAVASVIVVAVVAQPANPFAATATASVMTAPVSVHHDAKAAVRASVSAALRAAPIPLALSPSLDKAKDDWDGLGDCSAYRKTANKICELGDPKGHARMVAFGDSHSTMWVPALASVAKSAHWSLVPLVKEACGYASYLQDNACGRWYSWVKQTLTTLRPDVVVLSVYVNPGWENGIRSIVGQLKGYAPRVVLLSDVPGVRVAPVDCLLKEHATQKTCLWSNPPKKQAATATARQIAREAKIDFIDVAPWFCYQDHCPSVIDSIVAYIDIGHISKTYSRYLAPELRPALALDGSRSR